MNMTRIRKKAQDKLRLKFGYSTSDDRGRSTILYKDEVYEYETVTTAICMPRRMYDLNKEIEIRNIKYRNDKVMSDTVVFLSLEDIINGTVKVI